MPDLTLEQVLDANVFAIAAPTFTEHWKYIPVGLFRFVRTSPAETTMRTNDSDGAPQTGWHHEIWCDCEYCRG